MKNYVDLSVFEKQTLALKLPNGEVLQLRKPTQAMVIEILKFKNLDGNSPPEEILRAMDEVVLQILNSNEKLITYTQEDIEEILNISMKMVIIQTYAEFIAGIQSNPN